MASVEAMWEEWVVRAFARVDNNFLSYLPKVCLAKPSAEEDPLADVETFDGPGPWDRTLLEDGEPARNRMLLFSANDYLNLSTHPAVRKASAKAALAFGMGPRSSAMASGQTEYHRRLENVLAEMHKKEACVVTPTGFAANTAFLAALGAVATHNAASRRPAAHEKIAVFSDALNHASIIDGLRMMERHNQAVVSVYRHSDMQHLDELLSNCPVQRKVVITDSLFSMEGDFAPMLDLVQLRKKHRFLFVIDEAHTAFVCGRNGGGIGEVYGIEDQIDIIVGTLSKAGGCLGGFVACSQKWSNLVRTTGRPYIFTTASPLPVIAGAYAAVTVARKEAWRRQALWNRVQEFAALTKHPATSPILSLVHMLERGFHIIAVRPPAVAPDACRLRVTLTSGHSSEDVRRLVAALSECIPGLDRPADQIVARL
ncbi:unnamed protein product [Spirodela intermedia]|uniref:serine C-palmitoyltransferase n=2 Tax=Spirodela intermedia TaxID=51605 RepID=A0A7I8KTK4_SPIIN|nr:unnamed protein product [Spirodela intermedia]CAA6664590.1 unnamed protein product [Spirodela intermedia]CAA7401183.1 unnamed protein product [Spirodela intermedia]CAA7401185.1 unnamed protein product [Spirodela intermedia]CAA7401186.1 unnamed protein product [Spirodela intermedia]